MPSEKYIRQHKKLRDDLKAAVDKARNELSYHYRQQATYYLVNLVTTWIKLKITKIDMKAVDVYVWRIDGCKQKAQKDTCPTAHPDTHNL